MKRFLLSLVLPLLCATAAAAAAYDDFTRGVSANLRGDTDLAIASFTAALNAGDLSPNLLPAAYLGRANALLEKGRCDDALKDTDLALAQKPGSIDVLQVRAAVHLCLGKTSDAIADYSAILAKQPNGDMYRASGIVRWRAGDYAGAAGDFMQASRLRPRDPYSVLWLAVAEARGGTLDTAQVKAAMAHIDDDDWPGPAIAVYLGTQTPDQALAAASKEDEDKRAGSVCEANFYSAEWYLSRGDTVSAKPLLDNAFASCPHNYLEYGLAKLERGRMK
jgi:lipoprotein NlpI